MATYSSNSFKKIYSVPFTAEKMFYVFVRKYNSYFFRNFPEHFQTTEFRGNQNMWKNGICCRSALRKNDDFKKNLKINYHHRML